MAYLCT